MPSTSAQRKHELRSQALESFERLLKFEFSDPTHSATLHFLSIRQLWFGKPGPIPGEAKIWISDRQQMQKLLVAEMEPFIERKHNDLRDVASYWVHLPSLNGPALVAIAKAAGTHFDYDPKRWVAFMTDDWKRPSVLPVHPGLAYREPSFDDSGTEFTSVVFPYFTHNTRNDLLVRARLRSKLQECVSFQDKSQQIDGIGIHSSRTLDEAYYPSLERRYLDKRNDTQVISNDFDGHTPGVSPQDCPILMVSQLWFFQKDGLLITAFDIKPGNDLMTDMFKAQTTSFQGSNGETTEARVWIPPGFIECSSLQMQIAIIIVRHIESFVREYFDERTGMKFLAPLDAFERATIALLQRTEVFVAQDKREPVTTAKETERHIIFGISDVIDELAMIESVLKEQKATFTAVHEHVRRYPELFRGTKAEDIRDIRNAFERLEQYLARVAKINKDAERIQQAVDNMLNMKRANAAVEDAQSSILIGVAALGFAIVTIIFTPLAFLTGLFALPIEELQRHQKSKVYSNRYIGGIFAGTEAATLIVTGLIIWVVLMKFHLVRPSKWLRGETNTMNNDQSDQDATFSQSTDAASSPRSPDQPGSDGPGQNETPKIAPVTRLDSAGRVAREASKADKSNQNAKGAPSTKAILCPSPQNQLATDQSGQTGGPETDAANAAENAAGAVSSTDNEDRGNQDARSVTSKNAVPRTTLQTHHLAPGGSEQPGHPEANLGHREEPTASSVIVSTSDSSIQDSPSRRKVLAKRARSAINRALSRQTSGDDNASASKMA